RASTPRVRPLRAPRGIDRAPDDAHVPSRPAVAGRPGGARGRRAPVVARHAVARAAVARLADRGGVRALRGRILLALAFQARHLPPPGVPGARVVGRGMLAARGATRVDA